MAPFFQPVISLIASNPPPNGRLDLVLKLCEAIEAESRGEIVLAAAAVVRDVNPRMSPPVLIPETVFYEAMSRLLLLGEDSTLADLLDWYHQPISFADTRKERLAEHWAGIFEFISLPDARATEAQRERAFARMVAALRIVLAAHAEAVKVEGPIRPHAYVIGELPPGSFGTATYGRPRLSTVLADGIRRLVVVWMVLHQHWLDAAQDQLAANGADRGKGLRALQHRWIKALGQTFGQASFQNSAPFAAITIPLEVIRYGRSPHHEYLDAFPVRTDRRFGFRPYDRRPQDEPPPKEIALEDVLQRRHYQLHFLLDLFGEIYPAPATLAPTETRKRDRTFAERRQLIDLTVSRGGSLDLRGEDGLVSFGCAFLGALMTPRAAPAKAATREEAWSTFFALLSRYVQLFTRHTKFNLDERPSYFNRAFPRAIDGGELLDCGVYAVRLLFVLLSLGRCLRSEEYPKPPRGSFLLLPVHVGLIVEIDGLPPVVVHNDLMIELGAARLQDAWQEWQQAPERHEPPDAEALRQKFLEDVAAQLFIRDLDMPLRREPVGSVSDPPRKDQIWRAYLNLVVAKIDGLFHSSVRNPGSSNFEFDLRFLYTLEREKRWHDDHVVPFWNRAWPSLWETVIGRGDLATTRQILERSAAKRQAYAAALENLVAPVRKEYGERYSQGQLVTDVHRQAGGLCDPAIELKGPVLALKGELTAEFRANSGLAGPSATRITRSCRLAFFASGLGSIGELNQHLLDVQNFTSPPLPDPPFVRPLSRYGN